MDWLIARMIDWLIEWSIDWMNDWLIDGRNQFSDLLIKCFRWNCSIDFLVLRFPLVSKFFTRYQRRGTWTTRQRSFFDSCIKIIQSERHVRLASIGVRHFAFYQFASSSFDLCFTSGDRLLMFKLLFLCILGCRWAHHSATEFRQNSGQISSSHGQRRVERTSGLLVARDFGRRPQPSHAGDLFWDFTNSKVKGRFERKFVDFWFFLCLLLRLIDW